MTNPTQIKLTPSAVHNIFSACLFTDDELKGIEPGTVPNNAVVVRCVNLTFGLNYGRLIERYEEIVALLDQLPVNFKAKTPENEGGDGWSFLNACLNADGDQWGEQRDARALFALGMAICCVEERSLPGALAMFMPGGAPYFVVDTSGSAEEYSTSMLDEQDIGTVH